MNVLKRAFLYDTRKRGKSLTLFLLFTLITIFVTISFSVLSATQAAATNLRETVGASFTLRGKPMELSASGEDYAMQFVPISQQDIDLIADNTEIKAYLLGIVLCTAAVTLASLPIVKMKPKNILSQMS